MCPHIGCQFYGLDDFSVDPGHLDLSAQGVLVGCSSAAIRALSLGLDLSGSYWSLSAATAPREEQGLVVLDCSCLLLNCRLFLGHKSLISLAGFVWNELIFSRLLLPLVMNKD
ncbi:hypothetical protein TNIN_96591 [Trichonephila inaurata madagascariensis]|uniref:Uncharacterized protein n=1 Tax=Trichonephila inaurata madagascariensis TaxID=2747483 RepID=A0A8X6KGQ8_9ARAC|nr:hypothetical protein TNIN_96591 [Trichonephila inaurata madagascariensis]